MMNERKIIYIDVADMSQAQAEAIIEEVRDNLRAGRPVDVDELREKYRNRPNWLGFWFAVVVIGWLIYLTVKP